MHSLRVAFTLSDVPANTDRLHRSFLRQCFEVVSHLIKTASQNAMRIRLNYSLDHRKRACTSSLVPLHTHVLLAVAAISPIMLLSCPKPSFQRRRKEFKSGGGGANFDGHHGEGAGERYPSRRSRPAS